MLLVKGWPPGLQIKILSAKYGLIDATTIISQYDQRFDSHSATSFNKRVLSALQKLSQPEGIFLNLGADYLNAVRGIEKIFPKAKFTYAKGPIGMKMKAMKSWLEKLPSKTASIEKKGKSIRSYIYFFPDWDDYVDEPFIPDEGKEPIKAGESRKAYAHEIYGKDAPYDGVLLSLSHMNMGKGAIYRMAKGRCSSGNLREVLQLPDNMLLFGDCGAFSYTAESKPPFSTMEALDMYHKYGFDIGASVDHIPLQEIVKKHKDGSSRKRILSLSARYERVKLTTENAAEFIGLWKKKNYSFIPMGVIQGVGVRSYISCLHQYIDMGYRHIALGGLVPRSDSEIIEIVGAVRKALQERTRGHEENLWLHLFGILRPKLQPFFRTLGVSSFDSASYFRKAWLRSDQNYLAVDGTWYAAVRVPFSDSKAIQEAVADKKLSKEKARILEENCLRSLGVFGDNPKGAEETLIALNRYGPLLERQSEDNHFAEKYEKLLSEKPWERCNCPICRKIGINVVIFRGANRNKRRGFHNTWVFYKRFIKS
ncbi:MAG: hypothetical protein C4520_02870 [Candidatus Abyssobacteria bacterium SURF_5]|uniref:tRNA-guanine(15) transglycosylase-like domain-containing protein n=1 Tax=Abyssobacteria bacterium (strain SURF_5) TaxID=2093360 RepID=A0A3A4P2P2_ABYX5|nr:MAG: hypothetical protein C4520_02870 [Candidatus Abyssubacteria bacterium SURF_5]